MMFLEKCREAAKSGVVIGVKLGVAILIVALVLSWLSGDYLLTRQRSVNGQAAFEYLNKMVASQQQPAPQADPSKGK